MKVIGIRTAPAQLRYAVLEIQEEVISLTNSDSENLIRVPAGMEDYSDKLAWQKEEIDRIIRQNPDVQKIVLKIGEYGRSDTKSNRLGAYFDAAVILAAKNESIFIITKLYSQLSTKRNEVKVHAENRVGRTSSHWNEQMADAVVAAWSERDSA